MKHICECCGKEFESNRPQAKYCCIDCRNNSKIKYKDKSCKECGKTFHPLRETQEFCSPECRLKGTDYRCVCVTCLQEFYSKVPYSKYCCEECRKTGKKKLNKEVTCEVCRKTFHPWHKGGKYCSNKCKRVARKTIKEKVCPICNKAFLPSSNSRIYCSKKCYNISLSNRRDGLSKEKQKEIIDKMHAGCKHKISSENKKYARLLEKNGYDVSFEFCLGKYYYDLKVGNTLLEINPFAYHSSNWAPRGIRPTSPMYHYDKTNYAINNGYKIINVRDWTTNSELLYIMENLDQTTQKNPTVHRYHKKTKEHLIGDNYDDNEMTNKGYVKIYDAGEKYIFNSTNIS